MSRNPHDPRLIFSVDNIRAFHLQNGEESELTPSGPQTLSLLMVPTTGPPLSPSAAPGSNGQTVEEDFYLHLHLPPELELPLPATTQIYHQPPRSYLIPRWDLGPDAGAFTRIEFPSIGHGPGQVSQEDVDTFETILAQCTAFLERAPPPPARPSAYNPATFGEEYGMGVEKPHERRHGQIVLVDEENGSVVGELGEGFNVVESPDVKPGSKTPVAVQLPEEGGLNQISVSNVTPEYLQTALHPAYAKSSLVQSSATASRLLITTSATIGNALLSGADAFTRKTKASPKPMTFTPATQERIRKIHSITSSAAGISAKTVHHISKYAQNFGAQIAGKSDKEPKLDKNGNPKVSKPGILNKSLIALSTLGDGIDESARTLLRSGAMAATTIVNHRYGPEAGNMTAELAGGFKNVGLVYIDAAGVSRRAILKSVAKGMIVGRMKDGKQLVVGGGDGGQVTPDIAGHGKPGSPALGTSANSSYGTGLNAGAPAYPRRPSPSPTPPPPYGTRSGVSLGGTPMQNAKR
ncbi:hypothetical protein VTO42DRAFT_1858 [Malbranchea cinnamomea]